MVYDLYQAIEELGLQIGGVFCCALNRAAGNATGLATSRQQPASCGCW